MKIDEGIWLTACKTGEANRVEQKEYALSKLPHAVNPIKFLHISAYVMIFHRTSSYFCIFVNISSYFFIFFSCISSYFIIFHHMSRYFILLTHIKPPYLPTCSVLLHQTHCVVTARHMADGVDPIDLRASSRASLSST